MEKTNLLESLGLAPRESYIFPTRIKNRPHASVGMGRMIHLLMRLPSSVNSRRGMLPAMLTFASGQW